MTRFALTATAVILSASAAPSPSLRQTRSAPPAVVAISGRVLADDTGTPLPNVRIAPATEADDVDAPVAMTDRDGRFEILAPAGRPLAASKSGYGRMEVRPAAPNTPLDIRLRRGAVISGRLADEYGDPIIGVRVTAELVTPPDKRTAIAATDTDDRGEYRLGSLPAGTFVVAVNTTALEVLRPGNGSQRVVRSRLTRTYYPGAAEAEELNLVPGDNRAGIDVTVSANLLGNLFSAVAALGVNPLARPLDRTTDDPGRITGRILDSDGRAIGAAQVVLSGNGVEPVVVRSDASGRFEFSDLPSRTFRVYASKPGYFPVTGSDQPESPSIDLSPGETRGNVDVTLTRWGTLAGHVFDEFGDPLQNVSVQLLRLEYSAGRRRLVPAASSRLTDDLGSYRLFGLSPGQYIVSAAVGDVLSADVPGYARAYFPGTPVPAEARFVPVAPGQDVAGIDITLSPTHTARITGRILDAAGQPTTGGQVTLMPSERSGAATSVPVGARLRADGVFEFPNVAPGQYVVQAYRGRTNSWTEGEFGALPVGVGDADVTGLVLRMSSGSSIAGHVTFESSDPAKVPPSPAAIELAPIPADGDSSPSTSLATADIRSDGRFEIRGISGPRRLQIVRAPKGWALKAIVANGQDFTDRPLAFGVPGQSIANVAVVLTDRISELVGTVRDSDRRPAAAARVLVFATDRDRWYPQSRFLRTAAAAADGAFSLTGLPFGTYYVAAVAELPSGGEDAWQDPGFLDALIPGAATATIGDGERVSVSTRLADPAGARR